MNLFTRSKNTQFYLTKHNLQQVRISLLNGRQENGSTTGDCDTTTEKVQLNG
jgi:hypothetical protein